MKIRLLLQLVVLGLVIKPTSFSLPTPEFLQNKSIRYTPNPVINELISGDSGSYAYLKNTVIPITEIQQMLQTQAITLNRAVINKVLTTLECARASIINPNPILTIIDYSLPSSEKRLWIFDLNQKKLLFHTYVAHGLRSGERLTNYFSNKNDSKASSLGVYRTEQSYYGREGLTLRLEGLDRGFNDNAMHRYIVMHGGWYVSEPFIKKYGRPGRSWGCPALPVNLSRDIINTIKDQSLFIAYYPDDQWFQKSKFLNCNAPAEIKTLARSPVVDMKKVEIAREPILFADFNGNHKREENEPILVVPADNYVQLFHRQVPLERMLRRQINNAEYVALSTDEFHDLATKSAENSVVPDATVHLQTLYFVVPEIIMSHGYYQTQMKIVHEGKIKPVKLAADSKTNVGQSSPYTVEITGKSSMNLKSTNQFIRWLGL